MKIEVLLEYQKLDLERIKIESDFASGKVCQIYNKCVKDLQNATKNIERINNEAEEMTNTMNSLIEQYTILAQDLSESENSMDEINDTTAAEFFIRKAEQLSAKINQLSKEIGAMSQRIAEVRTQYEKALATRNEARKQGKEIEGTYMRDLSEAKKRIAEIKAKMKDLESQIEERFVSFYKRMRQSQKGALVVPLQGTNCGGCFNDIPYGLLQKMDDNGIIDCPHCGRLIYKHQND